MLFLSLRKVMSKVIINGECSISSQKTCELQEPSVPGSVPYWLTTCSRFKSVFFHMCNNWVSCVSFNSTGKEVLLISFVCCSFVSGMFCLCSDIHTRYCRRAEETWKAWHVLIICLGKSLWEFVWSGTHARDTWGPFWEQRDKWKEIVFRLLTLWFFLPLLHIFESSVF